VENDEDALLAMKLLLEYHGALVVPTSDATSALALLARIKPDGLISDITMPVFGGWWLLAEARSRGHLDGVPTVAVTALDLTPEEITKAGFHAYLRKPVDPGTLCTTVHALAHGQRPLSA
jgi:two-component system, cell cycle response regulator